jgi:serine/threonine protein kinase
LVKELEPEDPQKIGPYRLVGLLGQGGMGRVYLGMSPGGRPVAVKAIRAELAADPEFRARFGREVSAARRVSGAFTAQVVDADVDGPVAWMATAYVPGPTLAEAVDTRGPLSEAALLTLAAGLAESLRAIHAAGVVHRDLKPSNVLLAEDGPRVIDFGISRATESTSLTREGAVIGALGFMSPEQATGYEVGPPSDIFSLGAVLTFAVTGEGPFGTGTTPTLLYRVVHGTPNLDRVPQTVRPLVERCLAKDPAQRPTADGLLAEVGAIQPTTDQEDETPSDTAPRNSVLEIGSHVSGYRIEAVVGTGGMATVFRALDERLGRQVALKVLAPGLAGDEDFRRRFIHESRAAAAVDHPNIIPVFEAGNSKGILFIAMRYVPGGDVRSLLEQDIRLSPEQVTTIISPVASALDIAHKAGLVHRDVKPSNMLLDSRSDKTLHVYLTDFGITTQSGDSNQTTGEGLIIGTINYMAPEQIKGEFIDGRTDQYALATSAYEMLSGYLPFSNYDSDASLLYAKVFQQPPALTSRFPGLPKAVDGVFVRALGLSPANRFATCSQFAEALAAALGESRAQPDAISGGIPGGTAEELRRNINIPVKQSFRYVHEPARGHDAAFASLGNDSQMEKLETRILHSHGGTFLITGFRGVGKSTLVLRALDEIVERSAPHDLVLPVTLSVARTTTTERLLFAIVRRVFEALSDSGVLGRLPPQTRHALIIAYMRTSLSFKETQSEARERSAGVDLSIGPGKAIKAVADFAVPKVSMSAKRSHSLATEAAFLAYSETDVEYDLMRIVSLVARTPTDKDRQRSLLRRLRPWRLPVGLPRLRLIIVLDEVDKLTIDQAGIAAVEDLLSGIKNVLTMSGAHFLIVAGPDLHDRAVQDAARGNGVYESVFGWRLYVPCIWDAPERLVADIVSEDAIRDSSALQLLANYLRFKARGMPRRLLQEVNSFIVWDGDRPRLQVDTKDMERVEFYARLERILQTYVEGNGGRRLFSVPIDEDRWRLGGYYIIDWVLQSEGELFTAADLLRAEEGAGFDPLLRVSRRNIEQLLDHLARHRILEVVRESGVSATVYADITESSDKMFCLAEDVRHLLYGFAARNESERAAQDISISLVPAKAPAPPNAAVTQIAGHRNDLLADRDDLRSAPQGVPEWPPPRAAAPAMHYGARADTGLSPVPAALSSEGPATGSVLPPPRMIGGRYQLGDLVGQGGLSSFYKGRDVLTGRQVMVKKLLSSLSHVPAAVARFRREAELTRGLLHPQIVRTYEVLDATGEDAAIILEWVSGPSIQDLITNEGKMPALEVVACGRVLAEALKYIADQKIVRLDLKPNNIIMADRGPVIRDLGTAFRVDDDEPALTKTGQFIGTPAFMAPELIEGGEADPRVDVYSLGLTMYYCLAGKNPWEDLPNQAAIMYAVVNEQIDLNGLPISPTFRAVLGKALSRKPDDRFLDAAAFHDALTDTSEWQSVSAKRELAGQ